MYTMYTIEERDSTIYVTTNGYRLARTSTVEEAEELIKVLEKPSCLHCKHRSQDKHREVYLCYRTLPFQPIELKPCSKFTLQEV